MHRLKEIERRRTFAIVSHPDAGKTTLTEKLLLFGGAIQVAGAVKSNKIKRSTTSDFMEIERQRGISVATSVMGFEYKGRKVNILDTPGHQDFAEDTFRTLTAVDSAIVVVDVAKGVEQQTEKLVGVCSMRKTPMIVFINKLDRVGREPMELLDELEEKLGLSVCPVTWPLGMGTELKGVYSLLTKKLILFRAHSVQDEDEAIVISDLADERLDAIAGSLAGRLRDEVELISGVYPEFSKDAYLAGELQPVFFGSAINNFGVAELLNCFVDIAPPPLPAPTDERMVDPKEEAFSGFVFKIHANMDPKHRNRIAFLKVCSGVFQRNTVYNHVRLGKQFRFANVTSFMASRTELIDEAFPGDIVGIYDTGNFRIGDTLTEGEQIRFKGIPSFSPEMFRYVLNADPMKSKQLAKGIDQLMEEGVAQLFTSEMSGRQIIGTVGPLQFDVIQYRLEHEYGAKCRYETAPLYKACWVTCEDAAELERFRDKKKRAMAVDKVGRLCFMAESAYSIELAKQDFPNIQFHFTSELT